MMGKEFNPNGETHYRAAGMPVIGEVVGFTATRIRIASRAGVAYVTALRDPKNVMLQSPAKSLIGGKRGH